MALFNFGKKKQILSAQSCCCNCDVEPEISQPVIEKSNGELQSIKVLGAGCSSCHDQLKYAKEAVKNLGLGIEVEYITDLPKVMEYGVMHIPALVVNEQVVSVGKVLKTADVEKLLHNLGF